MGEGPVAPGAREVRRAGSSAGGGLVDLEQLTSDFHHAPVLLSETIAALQPGPGGRFIDATLGGGGHAEKLLESTDPNGIMLGIDADPEALASSSRRLARFGDRVVLEHGFFDSLESIVASHSFEHADGVLFDLGVSSHQLDSDPRGFSFARPGPLDMRMDPSSSLSAADLVNSMPVAELETIFRDYGEERWARRIARRIGEDRSRRRIETTTQLAEVVAAAKPSSRSERIHPATRIFQALRITVNDELGRLTRALPQALRSVRPGGRIAVISFHSLEDRIVKRFIRDGARGCICPPEVPVCVCGRVPSLAAVVTKPITASAEEVERNPRARSAKLRVAEKLALSQAG